MKSLKIGDYGKQHMKILQINELVKKQLRESGISKLMRSFESCEWIVVEELENRIIGVAGMGGSFHVSAIQIIDEFQGRGIGTKLQKAVIKESKRRGYSFIAVYLDPRNKASVKLHNSLGYVRIFRIHYSPHVIQDIMILIFNSWGQIIAKLLRLFNTKAGMFFLGCLLKIFRFAFPNIILYNEDNPPKPSIRWILKNFEKV